MNLHKNIPSWCIYLARMERTAKQKLLTGRTGEAGEQGQRISMFYREKELKLFGFLPLELQENPSVFYILAVCVQILFHFRSVLANK